MRLNLFWWPKKKEQANNNNIILFKNEILNIFPNYTQTYILMVYRNETCN